MSNNATPLMNFLSFGNTSDKPDSNTYALLFSQESVEEFPDRTVFTCRGIPTFLLIRKGLLLSTEEPPISLQTDFVIRIYTDSEPTQPVPPVIIRGNGSSEDLSFTVTTVDDKENPPQKLPSPLNPFDDQYIVIGISTYNRCDVSPAGSEPIQFTFALDAGFSLLLPD